MTSATGIADALARARAAGERVALVTVAAADGDVAEALGQTAVVDGAGAVRAGELAEPVRELGAAAARAALAGPAIGRTAEVHPVAGGSVRLVTEPQEPGPAVVALGATALARGLAGVARQRGLHAVVVAPGGDARVAPGVEVRADDPERVLLAAPPGPRDAVVATDPSARWLDAALRVALASDAPLVAVAGDDADAARIARRLEHDGAPRPARPLTAVAGEPDEALAALAAALGDRWPVLPDPGDEVG